MKIAASQVQLTSHHEEYYQSAVEAHVSRSFQDVLATQKKSGENTEREQLAQMLTGLVESMIAALRGEKLSATGESGGISPVSAGKENVPLRSLPKREEVWHWNIAELQQEREQTQVQGSGWICTEDGRNLDFSLCVDMQREYRSEKTISSTEKIALRDPLVINFNGKAAQLSGERIDFDLDVDGLKEKIPGLQSGSGYLVFDRNHNGQVDDGGELFGVGSNDAFADLSRLDGDGNGWLDENDAAFADLRIWAGGESATSLKTLQDQGVGALWLGRIESPFALKDGANRLLGEIRSSGLWLSEAGSVGSLQQVDLAVEEVSQSRIGSEQGASSEKSP